MAHFVGERSAIITETFRRDSETGKVVSCYTQTHTPTHSNTSGLFCIGFVCV